MVGDSHQLHPSLSRDNASCWSSLLMLRLMTLIPSHTLIRNISFYLFFIITITFAADVNNPNTFNSIQSFKCSFKTSGEIGTSARPFPWHQKLRKSIEPCDGTVPQAMHSFQTKNFFNKKRLKHPRSTPNPLNELL